MVTLLLGQLWYCWVCLPQ